MSMEILSPAGHWEAMVAAVQNGADAVYFGAGDYNARRGAKNFTLEELPKAVAYCHLRGVRVYLTVNTLLTDRELAGAADLLREASRCGVDAIIVQDWGVVRLAQAVAPDLPLHGSTQMSVHTLSGVKALSELGLRCAVLARELSGEEIAAICKESPIAIEAFGHGALCMCYSGQCAMSALIGGRSGNRGACAQPCRLPYRVDDGKQGHPLSLKDACLARYLPELLDMGVASLKLEGRMKRPEYVAVITQIYSRLCKEHRGATAEEERTLALAFSRSGFTDGYWRGKRGPEMFGIRPENTPDPGELFAKAKAAYDREDMRRVPVELTARLAAGVPASLTVQDRDGNAVTVTGASPEEARSRGLTAEDVRDRLSKTGGTVFTVENASVEVEEGLHLSAADLNALRREGMEALAERRTALPERRSFPTPSLPKAEVRRERPLLTVSVQRPEQVSKELLAQAPAVVSVPVWLWEQVDPRQGSGETVFSLELPRIWRDRDEPWLLEQMQRAKERGYTAAQIHNIGQIALVRSAGLLPRGDFGLNIFNSMAVEFLQQQGLHSATLSFELRHEQMRDVRKVVPCEAVAYGRLPLMLTENCLVANRYGCKSRDLKGPCAAGHTLTDRRGERFPVCPVFGCRSEIENGKILFLADKPEWERLGLTYARLRFTTETAAECAAVLRRYRGEGDWSPDPKELTRGLFYRGVE